MFETGVTSETAADLAVEEAAAKPAGVEMLLALERVDLSAISMAARLEMLALYERSESALQARKQELLAGVDLHRPRTEDDWVREEIAAVLRLSPGTAQSRLSVARILVHRLRATLRTLRAGDLTYWHARALAEAVDGLDDDATTLVEAHALRHTDVALSRFRRRIHYALCVYDPDGAEERKRRARKGRRATHRPELDEMATLVLYGPADATTTMWTLADDVARRVIGPEDHRTLEQRRFDAFHDLMVGALDTRQLTTQVEVTIPANTLFGGPAPGELAGYGPITAGTARELALRVAARWRRLVTDPETGRLQAYGSKTYEPGDWLPMLTDPSEDVPGVEWQYRPSSRLEHYVKARDKRCAFPGCNRRARYTDVDHTVPWPLGATSPDNLHPLCRRHHRLKTENTGWRLRNYGDGSWVWISPTDRDYRCWPHDYDDP